MAGKSNGDFWSEAVNTAYIETRVSFYPNGRIEQTTYEWVGESPYTRVSHRLISEVAKDIYETEIQVGPYKLLRVDKDAFGYADFPLYVRKDKLGALRVALYRSTRLLDLAYRRLIVTLAVWRLAEYNAAVYPSWRDIKIVKRFLK